MGTTLHIQPWMSDRDGPAADCLTAAQRSDQLGAELSALEAEEAKLLVELNAPGFREQRHRAAGEALANGVEPSAVVPDVRARLREIGELKPPIAAAVDVLSERYSKALVEARAELSRELRPRYAELLGAMAKAAIDLLVAAQAEAAFRTPLRLQDISFSGGS